jgi:hypothetical protein
VSQIPNPFESDPLKHKPNLNHTLKLVPHSPSSLREIPMFMPNFIPKNNTLKGSVSLIFSFNIYHCKRSKNYYFVLQNCVYYIRENFKNLCQNRK